MKKAIIGLLAIGALVMTGCGAKEEEVKSVTCSTQTTINGLDMDLSYKITYQGKYVLKLEGYEKATSEDEELLDLYEVGMKTLTEGYQKIENYGYTLSREGNTVTALLDVDYNKIDVSKLPTVDSAYTGYIEKGKMKFDALRSNYEQQGCTCKEN